MIVDYCVLGDVFLLQYAMHAFTVEDMVTMRSACWDIPLSGSCRWWTTRDAEILLPKIRAHTAQGNIMHSDEHGQLAVHS